MLDLDKFHACMKIWQISRTKWTPVNEQNKAAKQRRTERAVLWMGVPWTEEKPLREAASKREARFANGRGNLFGAVPEGLL